MKCNAPPLPNISIPNILVGALRFPNYPPPMPGATQNELILALNAIEGKFYYSSPLVGFFRK